MAIIRYILVLGFLALMAFGARQEYGTIAWSADRRLTWKDFQGNVPSNDRAAATTASGITYRFSTSGTNDDIEVDFKIDTYFYPAKSWYRPALCDEVILSHEQLHFDISELYARELRKRLDAATFTHSNVKAKVRGIYRKINEELSEFQNRYDDETNFSRDRDQQTIWNKRIEKALRSK